MAEGDRRHSADSPDQPPPVSRKRWTRWLVVALAAAVLAAASALAFLPLTGEDRPDPSRDPAAVPPPPGLELPDPPPAAEVAAGLDGQDEPDAEAVRRAVGRLLDDPRLGGRAAVAVAGLGGGDPAYDEGPAVMIPASTLKVLTAVAALEALGPEATFSTSAVLGGSRVTLVGGGDPLLARRAQPGDYPSRADLATLARRTAEALGTRGVDRVSLAYDTTLFSGPAVSPHWEPDYLAGDVVSPITALWVDAGREDPDSADRSADPPAAAASAFATLLGGQGIEVVGQPRAAGAPPTAGVGAEAEVGAEVGTEVGTGAGTGAGTEVVGELLAEVRSAEVVELVQHLLETSDNEATEVLARQVALAEGEEASFAGATRALLAVADRLGVRTQGAVLRDASGLSRANRLPVQTLLDLLSVAADPRRPALAGAVAGLPVAGWTGSLGNRFTGTDASPPEGVTVDVREALGEVRAKTGTLTGVQGLAGVVTGRDGTVMAFVAQLDRVPVRYAFLARDRLDRLAAALAGCACGARPAAP